MFISRLVPPLRMLLQAPVRILRGPVRPAPLTCCSFRNGKHNKYSAEAAAAVDKTLPPGWVRLEPVAAEALVRRRLSMSPLEIWLSLRYSLPPSREAPPPPRDAAERLLEETVLPSFTSAVPVAEDAGQTPVTPLGCKNVLGIRRRKMNRHKYRKLMKRMKFVRRRVLQGRRKKKQRRFEEDLERVWTRAGLKEPPEGWTTPKIYLKHYGSRRD